MPKLTKLINLIYFWIVYKWPSPPALLHPELIITETLSGTSANIVNTNHLLMWVLASPVRTCVNISPHKLERKFSEHVSAMPALVFPQIYSKLVSAKMLAWIIYYYWYQPDQYRFNHTLCLLSFYLRHLMWIWFWNEDRRQISLFIICIECIMHLNQQAAYKKWKLCTKYNL